MAKVLVSLPHGFRLPSGWGTCLCSPNPPDPPPPLANNSNPDTPEVDLTNALQSLQISTRSHEDGWGDEDEAEYEFSLLVKIAEGIPAPRIVPIQGMRADMRRAWGQNYGAISEVQPKLFLATFKTHEKNAQYS